MADRHETEKFEAPGKKRKGQRRYNTLFLSAFLGERGERGERAKVAELVDAPDLGSGAARLEGSSPSLRTSRRTLTAIEQKNKAGT
jgi:hypothetical protein